MTNTCQSYHVSSYISPNDQINKVDRLCSSDRSVSLCSLKCPVPVSKTAGVSCSVTAICCPTGQTFASSRLSTSPPALPLTLGRRALWEKETSGWLSGSTKISSRRPGNLVNCKVTGPLWWCVFVQMAPRVLSYSKLLSTFSSAPACVVVSSDGRLVVVGTGQGMLHVLSTLSGQVWTAILMVFSKRCSMCLFWLIRINNKKKKLCFRFTGSEIAGEQLWWDLELCLPERWQPRYHLLWWIHRGVGPWDWLQVKWGLKGRNDTICQFGFFVWQYRSFTFDLFAGHTWSMATQMQLLQMTSLQIWSILPLCLWTPHWKLVLHRTYFNFVS